MTRVAVASLAPRFDLSQYIELWGHSLLAEVHSRAQLDDLSPGVEVVVAEAAPEFVNGEVVSACSQRGVRLIAVADSAVDHARAAACGVTVVGAEHLAEQLPELLQTAMVTPTPNSVGTGRVIAVWGAPGAPGASTIAINLAAEWMQPDEPSRRARPRQPFDTPRPRVCLVDLDSWSPSLAPMLGRVSETPGIAAAARLAEHEQFDEAQFARLAVAGAAGGSLLTGLTALDRWHELSPERIGKTFDALRQWNDLIVVDLGSRLADNDLVADPFAPNRGAAVTTVLDHAELVIGVGSADPVGLARLVRAWPEWNACVRGRHEFVINRVRRSVLGMQPDRQVRQLCAQFIEHAPIALLDDDPRVMDAALLRAETIAAVAPKSALRRSIRELALALR